MTLVNWPKEEGLARLRLGLVKFTLLKALKASART
jgi:hypothetical protein